MSATALPPSLITVATSSPSSQDLRHSNQAQHAISASYLDTHCISLGKSKSIYNVERVSNAP